MTPVASRNDERVPRRSDRGSVLPVVAGVLALVAGIAGLLVDVGVRLIDRAEAQTAADMAALAGVVEGERGAADLATLNETTLLRFDRTGTRVHVVVRAGSAEAEAWADLGAMSP